MTVYVDTARIPATVGRIKARWSHLTADTVEELNTFATRIGLNLAWYQTCKAKTLCPPETCPHWHYDVTETKRQAAIAAGATVIDMRQLGALISSRRTAARANKETTDAATI